MCSKDYDAAVTVGQGRVGPLDAEARQPPQRSALIAVWLGVADRDTDRQRIAKVDLGQFRRRGRGGGSSRRSGSLRATQASGGRVRASGRPPLTAGGLRAALAARGPALEVGTRVDRCASREAARRSPDLEVQVAADRVSCLAHLPIPWPTATSAPLDTSAASRICR